MTPTYLQVVKLRCDQFLNDNVAFSLTSPLNDQSEKASSELVGDVPELVVICCSFIAISVTGKNFIRTVTTKNDGENIR